MKKISILLILLINHFTFIIAQNNWVNQNSGTNKFLTDVFFIDQNEGWATGWTGTILHTEDGGLNWNEQNPPPNNAYESIFFANELTGWAVGYGGKIINTSDGGETWEDQVSGTNYYLLDVQFIDENTGWIVGGRFAGSNYNPIRIILHTTNGGETWINQLYEYNYPPLKNVHIVDNTIGYAVGESGSIIKTSNGGLNWVEQMYDQQYHFYDVFFTSPNIGWVVGQDLSLNHYAVVFKTIDGGNSWALKTLGTNEALLGIHFINSTTGWAVGGTGISGIALTTSDGGNNWVYEDIGEANLLTDVQFSNDVFGWAVGYDGTIIHIETESEHQDEDGGNNSHFDNENTLFGTNSLRVNVFPNPFISNTSFQYHLTRKAKVQLSIFNQTGKLVERIQKVQSTGRQKIIWNAERYPSGLYFYTFQINGQVTSGTLVKN